VRRSVSVLVALLLALVIAATIVRATNTPTTKRTVRGAIAGAMRAFFDDTRVQHELRKRGFVVDEAAVGAPGLDFALFPDDETSAPAGSRFDAPVWTPLVAVASPGDAERLDRAGVAHRDANGVWILSTPALMAAATRGEAVVSTGAPTSSPGSLFVALTSFVANGMGVPVAATSSVVNAVSPVFTVAPASATGVPSVDITFEASAFASPANSVVMYPNPDVVSDRSITSYSAAGAQFARLLATDASLARLAARLGFRGSDASDFARTASAHHLAVPPQINAVGVPAPAVLSNLSTLVDTAIHLR